MRNRTIGGIEVGAIGLGGMPMSIEGRPDEDRAIATIHAALDVGVTLIDTADAYHWHAGETGHNERLIAKALASYPGDTSSVPVATKGGHTSWRLWFPSATAASPSGRWNEPSGASHCRITPVSPASRTRKNRPEYHLSLNTGILDLNARQDIY